jgi:hypothetical protein
MRFKNFLRVHEEFVQLMKAKNHVYEIVAEINRQ